MLTNICAVVRKRPLASATACALLARVLLSFWLPASPVTGLTRGYIEDAATIASGKGPLMSSRNDVDVINFLKSREVLGRHVSPEDPFPPDSHGWFPATIHPPAYSLLLAWLYEIGNYTSMLWWVLRIQTILDALTCLLVYVFVRNLFGRDAGLVAAWIYALLPSPILLCQQILPDSLSCFFSAAILASASSIQSRGLRTALATGLIIGVAGLFRAELLLWSAILVLLLAISPGTVANKLRWSAALGFAQIAVLTPWILWTYRVTGHPLLTSSESGASMYESLGEIPYNPWGITLDDGWVDADAKARGLSSAWTPEADAYYRKMFLSCIREHPGSFVSLVITQRLPLALAPAYYQGGDMWFARYRLNEGLTRWQTVWKYPRVAVRHELLKFVMAFSSALLLGVMLYSLFLYRHALRLLTWLWVPWVVTTGTLCLLKQIEGRNLASNLVAEVAAAALVASHWVPQKQRTGNQLGVAAAAPRQRGRMEGGAEAMPSPTATLPQQVV
jgi:4-amino-4-deoxy-L-arabinose transferase-like glycosyltransferase